MAHTVRDKKKLLNRVHRIRGPTSKPWSARSTRSRQCSAILRLIAAARGAMNGLMVEVRWRATYASSTS